MRMRFDGKATQKVDNGLANYGTIVASKIKGTAREIYDIFPCNGDFPCIFTGCVYRENPQW